MQPDNIMPNDGVWYATPQAQKVEADNEDRKLKNARPLIQDVVKRLNGQIDFYGQIDSVEINLDEDPATHRNVMEAHRILRELLTSERDYIMSLIK